MFDNRARGDDTVNTALKFIVNVGGNWPRESSRGLIDVVVATTGTNF